MVRGHRLRRADFPITTAACIPQRNKLLVTCWCERNLLIVPSRVVRRGQTGSCGLPDCKEPSVVEAGAMNVVVLDPSQYWSCPNCDTTAVTRGQPNRFHPCPKFNGFSMPLVPAGQDCKVEANEREDYVNGEGVQTDDTGRPIMNAVITREDGNDCFVFAPVVKVRLSSD